MSLLFIDLIKVGKIAEAVEFAQIQLHDLQSVEVPSRDEDAQ
jgi:hypothetical protein